MDDEWDVENAEAKFDLAIRSNKWEGEDEDEDVKDSWEDVEEEKKDVEKPAEVPKAKPKPKKALAERIEEREKKAKAEAERKAKEKEEALTPEERRAEQIRRQRLQEEADLRLAMETFGVTEEPALSLDTTVPSTKEEFEQYGSVLTQKLNQLAKNAEFPPFGEELIKSVALNLSSAHLKKVKTLIDNLLIEKQKIEKGEKAKKNKGKGKAKLKIEDDNTLLSEYGDYVYDDYDDFM
ncbi:eukaryotic translation initiation factor 3 subunit J [Bombus vosnesenskii]|uniref:Eukaryotic translation initiation factor 3 subunit J n=2 Tax=Pyrobombus TaxID=144703 RepID=A0A6J3K4A4_9HYME|nr:eukaryotic translation initiation factor 3 subunit J [Bombus vancouverensis nearcticus]XP_033303607.1 eukaryotic translation initiation factor 3 subunit J [Bombus bifarius]XP_033347943.1 eukaryotic translation initiation factor 3 subunit J [Bombus vosnesenskii]XP_050487115.1 eukaryotic translation initiation factor 3 subunit J [Bombus huntii]